MINLSINDPGALKSFCLPLIQLLCSLDQIRHNLRTFLQNKFRYAPVSENPKFKSNAYAIISLWFLSEEKLD